MPIKGNCSASATWPGARIHSWPARPWRWPWPLKAAARKCEWPVSRSRPSSLRILHAANGSGKFRLVGGDERTRDFAVVAHDRPRVIELLALVTPPVYTGLPQAEFAAATSIELLPGTLLEVTARLNKTVERANVMGAEAKHAQWKLNGVVKIRTRENATK